MEKIKLKKGMLRVKLPTGEYVDVEKVLLKNLNRDYGFNPQILKGLAEAKLLPTIYDWDNPKKEPFFAKHEIIDLIEKMMLMSLDLMDNFDQFEEKIKAAAQVINQASEIHLNNQDTK